MECNIKIIKLERVLPNGTFPRREHNVRYFYHRTDGCYYMYDEKGCEFNLTTDGNIIAIDKELIVGAESLDENTLVCIGLKANYSHPTKGIKGDCCCPCNDTYIRAWTYMSDLFEYFESGHIKRKYYRVTLVPSPTEGGICGCSGSAIVPDESPDGFRFTFESGSKVQLWATPTSGYKFVGWKEFHSNEIMSITSNWSFTIKKDMELIAVFAPIEIPIENFYINTNAYPAQGGYTVGTGVFPKGTKHSITAAAIKGYHFVNWKDSANRIVSTNLQYDIVVERNETYTAYFEPDSPEIVEYTLSGFCDPADGGGIDGLGKYRAGSVAVINVWANEGFVRNKVFANTSSITDNNNGTWSIVMNQDVTVHATFLPVVANIPLAIYSDAHSKVRWRKNNGNWSSWTNGSMADQLSPDTLVEIQCQPDEGYEFEHWFGNDTYVITTENPKTLYPSLANPAYRAKTKKIEEPPPVEEEFAVTLTADTGGKLRYKVNGEPWSNYLESTAIIVKSGSVLQFNAESNSGYTFSQFTYFGQTSTIPSGSVVVNSNGSVRASFTKNEVRDLIVTAGAGGKCKVRIGSDSWGNLTSGTVTHSDIPKGTLVAIIATADSGYHFSRWTDAGAPASYTREFALNETTAIEAKFEKDAPNTYVVSGAYEPSGCANINGTGIYNAGDTCTIHVTVAEGYSLRSVTVDGSTITLNSSNEYSFVVNKNIEVKVTCAIIPIITTSQITIKTEDETTTKGAVGFDLEIPSKGIAYKDVVNGENITIVASPVSNKYAFDGWWQNGVKLSELASYVVQNVRAAAVYVAKFVELPYLELDKDTITFPAEGGTQNVTVTSNVEWTVS